MKAGERFSFHTGYSLINLKPVFLNIAPFFFFQPGVVLSTRICQREISALRREVLLRMGDDDDALPGGPGSVWHLTPLSLL